MRHSVSNHDLFPSKVEQGKHYVCDGKDLIKPSAEQYEQYKDGSHQGKKKLEENEKSEAERKRVEVRTKAGEKAKKGEVASTSREVDLAELMRKREEQVVIQNAGKIYAGKKEELLEQERATAEKKIQLEEQQKNKAEKNRKIKEDWQKKLRLMKEQKKKEDNIQFDKSLAKTLAIEGGKSETVVIKKGGRKEMTSAELDAECKELNATQMRVNTRAAVDQIVGARMSARKETQKSGTSGFKMMRAEEESEEGGRLPPVTEILNNKSKGTGAVEIVKAVIEKKGKKIVSVPAPIIEEMELEGEEVEVDFEGEQGNEGRVEISQDILNDVARTMQGAHEGDEIEPVETLSTTFLQSLVSDRMDIDLREDYEDRVQEIVNDLEESGREAEADNSPSRKVKEELIEREMARGNRKTGNGKVSSDSAEEGERIIIDNSTEGGKFYG